MWQIFIRGMFAQAANTVLVGWWLDSIVSGDITLAASIESPHLNVDLGGVYMDDCFKIKPSTPAASCT